MKNNEPEIDLAKYHITEEDHRHLYREAQEALKDVDDSIRLIDLILSKGTENSSN